MRKKFAATRSATSAPLACLLSLALSAPGVGCRPAPAEPAPVRQKPAPVPATLVYVDAQLVTECEIADTREFYPFDAFVWEDPNSDALKKIAHCIGQGKFRGRKVRIVAHDIPDSPDPYKTKFGKSRAASVREYLVFHGVKRDAVIVQPGEEAPRSAYIPDGRRVDLELIGAGPPVGASQGAAPDPGPAI